MSTLLTEPPLNPVHEIFHVDRILQPENDALPKREHKVIAVLPAYNAERTLAATLADFPAGCVDQILLVDDGSKDRTVQVACEMGLTVIVHPKNKGYGGNQKTCYRYALDHGADIVVMIHPDYQYDARVIPHAVGMIELGICDVILGSRVRSRAEALKCGMPWWKYVSNRGLTALENIALGQNLGDFHSGFRVYRRQVLETVPFERNSDDFVFDTQFLAQAVQFGFRLGDIPVPVRYFDEASSINFKRSTIYGIRTLTTMMRYWLHRTRLWRSGFLKPLTDAERADRKNLSSEWVK
jgi:glycosyltransferase involved in cell wall biosynthesis